MDTRSFQVTFTIRRLRFFRLLYYLGLFGSFVCFLFLGSIPFLVGLGLSLVCSAFAGMTELQLFQLLIEDRGPLA